MKFTKLLIIIATLIVIAILILNTFLKNKVFKQEELDYKENPIIIKKQNEFEYVNVSDQTMIEMYLNDYFYRLNTNIEDSYNLIDVQYKSIKYPTLEKYKEYISQNQDKTKKKTIKEYYLKDLETLNVYNLLFEKEEDKNYYIAIAEDEIYIIKEIAPMDYTIAFEGFITSKEVHISNKTELIEIGIVQQNIYFNKLEYVLNIKNLTDKSFRINTKNITLDYYQDENNIILGNKENSSENMNVLIKSNETVQTSVEFEKNVLADIKIKGIRFNDLVLDI